MNREEYKLQIAAAEINLKGQTVLEILQAQYSVQFRFHDTETGYFYYLVSKLNSTDRYTVKIKFVQISDSFFAVREFFSFCPCPRFQGERNCHHFLLAVHFEAERRELRDKFDLRKFAEFPLAKVYRKQLEKEMSA